MKYCRLQLSRVITHSPNSKQDKQCTCNVTLRCVHETIVAWKKKKYYILVCVCRLARACVRACVWVPGRVGACMRIRAYSLASPARNAYEPYCDVICGPSGFTILFDIISFGAIFGKKLSNKKFVF